RQRAGDCRQPRSAVGIRRPGFQQGLIFQSRANPFAVHDQVIRVFAKQSGRASRGTATGPRGQKVATISWVDPFQFLPDALVVLPPSIVAEPVLRLLGDGWGSAKPGYGWGSAKPGYGWGSAKHGCGVQHHGGECSQPWLWKRA